MSNTIIITHDNKTTTAREYNANGELVNTATAKCAPEDTFDFEIGAKLAIERLLPKKDEWVVVKRKPRVGDYIRLLNSGGFTFSKAGDILKVSNVSVGSMVKVKSKDHPRQNEMRNVSSGSLWNYLPSEYEVVEKSGKTIKVEPKPTVYNGKVVCIKSGYDWWTVGKVYEVKDGIITSNDGDAYPKLNNYRYCDAEDVRHAGCNNHTNYNEKNEFIPFVES